MTVAGVVVTEEFGPVAHSDGDIVYHALVDALLGAAGLGDIGEHFPDTDPRWKDAASRVFVEHVMGLLVQRRITVVNADVTLLLERPKVKKFKPQMIENLRTLLNAPVNVKAATNELCDSIGRGEAVAAHAVVLLTGEF